MEQKLDDGTTGRYLYLHFAEIQDLIAGPREFSISWNGNVIDDEYSPPEFVVETVPIRISSTCDDNCYVKLRSTNWSNFPPSMNAMEVFWVLQLPQPETDENDGLSTLINFYVAI